MTELSASTRAGLESVVPGGVTTRAADRLRMAHDASHYLLHPGAVITPADAGQVAALLAYGRRTGTALTFRSGGTSLSGQAVTDRLLVDVRRHFRDLTVLDDGRRVRVQPGVVLRQVNARLAPYGRKLGPDPASESACTVGGVVANNSSGMTCGTEFNTYRTLESLVLALPGGTVLDTGAPDADARLRAAEPDLHAGLLRLRDRVRGNPDSVRRIRAQYAMKNTMGYGVNAFLDHDDPADLLTRLVVGSEGTLAFVASATFRTVPVHRHAATGLLVFDTLGAAMAAMPALVAAGPAAIELLDAAALRVAQRDPKADATLRGLAVRGHAALLAEWQESDPAALADRVADAGPVLSGLPLSAPARLSGELAARAALWHIRKGLYAAVAGARPSGTTALLEDIAVPVEALAGTCASLAELFERHRYADSVIFGHAKDGNLHFMLNERFDGGEAPARYADFTEEMVDLVLGHGGTLKAEHGTGRVMAPYVRRQFGDELYEVMRELKTLCDPDGVLNPGVLLSDDPEIHMRHLKTVPTVEEEVDRCVECGYCEPVCPSRDLTTTPRQRIVLRREIAAAQAAGDTALARELTDDYDYDAVQTCAVDGMCATACPVLINTGDLVKRLRAQEHGRTAGTAWRGAARRWGVTTRGMARGLDLAGALPPALPEAATRAARAVLGADRVPRWQRDLPRGGTPRRPHPADDPDAVFVPSCLGTLFAPAQGGTGVAAALLTLADRAGVRLLVPDGIGDLCCGTPWSSKGLADGYRSVRDRVPPVLRAASRDGALPVVSDAASCTEGFERLLDGAGDLRVVDAVAYTAGTLLPRLTVRRRIGSLALHPTCSSVRLGLDDALLTVARAVADEVVVPDGWQCCGFAGDRGLLHPELTASATRAEAAAVAARPFDGYASVNRTCEIGLARATGQPYRHLLELLAEVTAP
ncbi:FAD-binding and (Fe-S)-binding domain-containing protein [Micromonospora aurantiaca (nom. illeg.)]|uniref:D-lactate dehydrogenase (cytochrome) n=1 Tax=Micromonospora aurantiaca (nom. illeg.) TaxID=47850 RepID=A0ABQ6UD82_9ACTN|nr:FAD-binding and (Fe-S)-binding domain-containing protein [Micromonospora aurantiaca]KAB1109018.1 FAD-binding oxidoreductase [Micromonospora aurantiaca]UFN91682.1 FAD-binding oxidoreductase [Micromonospora aurantiaca]